MIKIYWTDWLGKDHQILCTSFDVEAEQIDSLCTIKYKDKDGNEYEEEVSYFSVAMEDK